MAEIAARDMSKQMSSPSVGSSPRSFRPTYSQPSISSQYSNYYGVESFSRHSVMSPPPQISRMTAGPYMTNGAAYNANFRNRLQRVSDRRHGTSQIPSQTYLHQTSRTWSSSRLKTTYNPFQPLHKQISGTSLESYDGLIDVYESMPSQHTTSDVASDGDYIQMYRLALMDPKTGITLQERKVNGRMCQKIFTGADAAEWFMDHIEGIVTVDGAASVGHKLVALGIIQNAKNPDQKDFTVSPREFYCFTESAAVNQMISTIQEPEDDPTVPGDVNTTYHDFTKKEQQGCFSKFFSNCWPCW